jgi:hypothetical protein
VDSLDSEKSLCHPACFMDNTHLAVTCHQLPVHQHSPSLTQPPLTTQPSTQIHTPNHPTTTITYTRIPSHQHQFTSPAIARKIVGYHSFFFPLQVPQLPSLCIRLQCQWRDTEIVFFGAKASVYLVEARTLES